MKQVINRFFNYNDNSLFHIFIHAGFVVGILLGLVALWVKYFLV